MKLKLSQFRKRNVIDTSSSLSPPSSSTANINKEKLTKEIKSQTKIDEPSLALCLIKVFYGKFMAGAFLQLIAIMLIFVGPIMLE